MVGQQRHTNLKWRFWRRPQGHYFLLQRHSARDCAHVIVGRRLCFEEVGNHHAHWRGRTKLRLRLKQKQVDRRLRILTVPGAQEEARRNGVETETNKTSLVVMLLLRVMTYVVFYQPFWNWIGVVRFVSHEVWSEKDLSRICHWHFLHWRF